jgi:DHA1 family tetracycline resistance protein-like MFS transporter
MASAAPDPSVSIDSARALRFVISTVFIDSIGFGIVLPVVPALVMALEHGTLAQATRTGGWLAFVYAIMQFLFGPLMGGLGDRFGRRPVLLGALGGYAADYLLMGFAPTIGWLVLGRLLAGLFGASYGPAMAALSDVAPDDEKAKTFGMVSAAFGIGFVVGPAIGGLLGAIGPRAPFYAASALAACNFLYGLVFFPETLPVERRRKLDVARLNPLGALKALGHAGPVIPLLTVYFFWQLASMVYPVTWSYFAIAAFHWSSAMIGVSLAVVGAIMAAMQVTLVGRTVRRFGERRTAMLGFVGALAGFIGYALVRSGTVALVILVVTGTQTFVQPSLMAMMSRRVPADQQGELQGMNGSLAALASIIAPIILTQPLAYFTSMRAPFYFPGAAFAVSAVVTLIAMALLAMTPKAEVAPA